MAVNRQAGEAEVVVGPDKGVGGGAGTAESPADPVATSYNDPDVRSELPAGLETVEVVSGRSEVQKSAKPKPLDLEAARSEKGEESQTTALDAKPDGGSVELIHERRIGRRGLILIAAIVLVLAGAAVTWYILPARNNKPLTDAQRAKQYEDVTTQARQQADLREYGDQVNTLENYLNSKPPEAQAETVKLELAKAYAKNGQYEQAITLYRELEKKDAYRLDARRGLGNTHLVMGERGEARRYFQMVVDEMKTKTDPESKFQLTEDEANLYSVGE